MLLFFFFLNEVVDLLIIFKGAKGLTKGSELIGIHGEGCRMGERGW